MHCETGGCGESFPYTCGWADKILGTSDVTPQVVVGLKRGEDKVEMGEDRGLIGWTISSKG
jgi:hypothetical protein